MDNAAKSKRMTWFRFYSEALDDPKVQRLAPHLFKAWVNLLCLASTADGKLPSIDDIAFRLRVSAADAEQQISDLIIAGLIDVTQRGRVPHNWNSRQFVSDSSTERVRKHRKINAVTRCNVSETADETAPEQIQSRADTDSDSVGHERVTDDRPSEPDFVECKNAFNCSTEAMLTEIAKAMGPYGDRAGASQWLLTTLRTNGPHATAQAFQMLATSKAEGQIVSHPLRWWAKTASSLKAGGGSSAKPKTEFIDRAAAKRAADRAYLESIGAM